MYFAEQELVVSHKEAKKGAIKYLFRNHKTLEVIIPPNIRSGNTIRLTGALTITDGVQGDILLRIKIRNPSDHLTKVVIGLSVLFFIIVLLTINSISNKYNNEDDFLTVFHDAHPNSNYIESKPIKLINNPEAVDPTWEELYEFLLSDDTDENYYIEYEYECGNFAEDVHNNAEAIGIKAAWVGIWFVDDDIGHALNAFNVVDLGLVYVDCSGLEPSNDFSYEPGDIDMIAYVQQYKALGEIPIREVESLNYSYYKQYEREWNLYHDKYIYIIPQGIVESVEIYW